MKKESQGDAFGEETIRKTRLKAVFFYSVTSV